MFGRETKTEERLHKLLNPLLMIPIVFILIFSGELKEYAFKQYDHLYPPVSGFEFINERANYIENYVEFDGRFTKNRCTLRVPTDLRPKDYSVLWYNQDGELLHPPEYGFKTTISVPSGNNKVRPQHNFVNRPPTEKEQTFRGWRVYGITELRGSRGVAVHYCGHGVSSRLVFTEIYPSDQVIARRPVPGGIIYDN